jgi:hypothetical protein
MTWRPIETAPRDRWILLEFPSIGINIGKWNAKQRFWQVKWWINFDFPRRNPPIHWMHLPQRTQEDQS